MSRLIAHVLDGHTLDIRPAPPVRPWMEATDRRFAHRCLPMNIANGHGWEILSPTGFEAYWDGTPAPAGVVVWPDDGASAPALGHFGHGVLTFHIPCVFETEPGIDLFVTGPLNRPKDAIGALTGVIETDWAPYSFTMNWLFTRPDAPVRFERGEPFCHLFPIARRALETVEPEILPMAATPEMARLHREWAESRTAFNASLKSSPPPDGPAWQKTYFQGLQPSGEPGPRDHRNRLRLKPFRMPPT